VQLLRKIAFPISLAYAVVVGLRNYLYDLGLLESKAYPTPIICVGNLSVGGTGKTPMIEYLISILKTNHRIAVLSRGYRRKSKGFVLADSRSNAEAMGDEPYQIHSKFPEIAVAVDADRQEGIEILEKKIRPDVILLDDAFQHRKVRAGFNILLTAYRKLYTSDWYLPTGNLRDGARQATRAQLIVVTKCPPKLSQDERKKIQEALNPKADQKVLFSCLSYGVAINENGEAQPLDYFRDRSLTLVTGIADPAPLTHYLHQAGLNFEHARYKDHHNFTKNELETLRSKPLLITTEKDFMRLKGKIEGLFYIPVAHSFLGDDGQVLEQMVGDFMRRDS
jgi:tetraacyldisaccharide 4'-kinase